MKRLIIFISFALIVFFSVKQKGICANEKITENLITVDQLVLNPDWIVTCDQQSTRHGDGVSSGDLNGDGFDDVVFGAPVYEPNGAVFIYYGSAGGPSLIADKVLYGSGWGFGNRVNCKGDVNKDGFKDLIIGDPFNGGGKVWVFHGSSSGISDSATAQFGPRTNGSNFGFSVSSADVNGDGYSDLIAGVSNEVVNNFQIVGAYILPGSPSGIIDNPLWTASVPVGSNYEIWYPSLSGAGDINSDGFEDVIISEVNAHVFVYLGAVNKGMYDPADFILTYTDAHWDQGVSDAGDINSDGYNDIAIGTGGAIIIYYGSQNGLNLNFDTIRTEAFEVSSAGDFNNDGYGDLISSVFRDSIHLYFGSPAGILKTPVILNSPVVNLSSGDINGDGFSDVVGASEPHGYGFYGSANIFPAQITSFFPLQNAISVNKLTDITVEFGQEMNTSTLNSSNIIVDGSYTGVIASNINYNAALKTLTLDPLTNFKTGEKISVTLKSGIQTENNIPIDPFIFSFISEVTGTTDIYQISDTIMGSGNFIFGDADNDGDIDIITANGNAGIKIFTNNGSGIFSYYSQIADGTENFILKDFDLDHDLDIIFGAQNNTIKFYTNDGTGLFSFQSSSAGNLAKRTGDFDGDGDLDMAAILSGFDMSIYRNDNGVFTLTSTIPVPYECSEPQYYYDSDYEIDDMDGDGDLDIVEVHRSFWTPLNNISGCMYLEIFRNDGAGNFVKETLMSGSFFGSYNLFEQYYVTLFNLEGDNDNDILLYNAKLVNNSNSEFNILESTEFTGKPATADIDGDGDLDFITTYNGEILKNDGNGNFSADGVLTRNDKLSFADLNNDGDLDIALIQDNNLIIYFNSDLVFTQPEIITLSPAQNLTNADRASEITVVFDQSMDTSTINDTNIKVFGFETGSMQCIISYDNSLNKIIVDPVSNFKTGEKISVILTPGIRSSENIPIEPFTWTFTVQAISGTGIFTEVNIIDTTGSGIGAQIVSGDFNGDGKPDLAQMNSSPEVYIYFNDGNADFTLTQIISNPASVNGGSVASADLDSDGDLDLFLSFVGNYDSVYIYKNNGSGVFAKSFSANYNSGYRLKPVVDDFDADGDLDIISSISTEPRTLNLFLNDGIGNLTHSVIPYSSGFARGVSSGDIDNDGDMDLITIRDEFLNPGITILKNDGNANFSILDLNLFFFTEFCPNADLDSDGDIDFVTKRNVFFNDGTGNFTPVPPQGFADYAGQLILADLDSDGDIDKTEFIENGADIYKNNGSGEFLFLQNVHTGESPFFGTSGDLDNDGDVDLVVSNESGHHWKSDISILLNDYNCTHPDFSISGNSSIAVGSVNNLYVSSSDSGYWDITNYDNTQASIPPNSTGDSVLVSAGNSFGHFELYFIATYDCGGDTILSKHVYIDNPLPVELASFNSIVSRSNVTLNWSTTSELNNSGFDIEKFTSQSGSAIKNEWSKVSFVNGSGTISEPVNYTFTDKNLSSGKYKYRLKQIDFNGNFEYFELAEEVSIGIPDRYELSQNYPNPFNPVTNLEFGISELGFVSLKIYDVTGRELITLVNEVKEPGYYNIKFDASNLSSGVYFYRLVVSSSNSMITENFIAVKKMVVLK